MPDGACNVTGKSADFRPFLEAVQPFYDDIEEMTHYQVTATATGVTR